MSSQLNQVQDLGVDAVDRNSARVDVECPEEDVEQRTLAGTGSSDDSDLFPRFCVEGKVAQGQGQVFSVSEVDVLELDDAFRRPVVGGGCGAAVQVFLWNVPGK